MSKSDTQVLDFQKICRLCLVEKRSMSSIFSKKKSDKKVPLPIRIMTCASLELYEGDGLPASICSRCLTSVNQSFAFREQCEQADSTLRQYAQQMNNETSTTSVEDDGSSSAVAQAKTSVTGEASTRDSVSLDGKRQERSDEMTPDCSMDVPEESEALNPSETVERSPKKELDGVQDDEDDVPLLRMWTQSRENFPNNVRIKTEEGTDQTLETNTTSERRDRMDDELAEKSEDNENGKEGQPQQQQQQQQQVEAKVEDGDDSGGNMEEGGFDPSCFVVVVEESKKKKKRKKIKKEGSSEMKLEMRKRDAKQKNEVRKNKVKNSRKLPTCDVCKETFFSDADRNVHITTKHMNENNQFLCDFCTKVFKTKAILKDHRRKHLSDPEFLCVRCGKLYYSKGHLTEHNLYCLDEKKFECPICKKRFNVNKQFKRHFIIHEAERYIKCTVCEQTFSRRDNYRQHFRRHTGEKPYTCDICGKSFRIKATYNYHRKTHRGMRPNEAHMKAEGGENNLEFRSLHTPRREGESAESFDYRSLLLARRENETELNTFAARQESSDFGAFQTFRRENETDGTLALPRVENNSFQEDTNSSSMPRRETTSEFAPYRGSRCDSETDVPFTVPRRENNSEFSPIHPTRTETDSVRNDTSFNSFDSELSRRDGNCFDASRRDNATLEAARRDLLSRRENFIFDVRRDNNAFSVSRVEDRNYSGLECSRQTSRRDNVTVYSALTNSKREHHNVDYTSFQPFRRDTDYSSSSPRLEDATTRKDRD